MMYIPQMVNMVEEVEIYLLTFLKKDSLKTEEIANIKMAGVVQHEFDINLQIYIIAVDHLLATFPRK